MFNFDLRLDETEANRLLEQVVLFDRHEALAGVRGELTTFEHLYDMTTAEMRSRVLEGRLPESEEICAWLMVDNRRRELESTTA